MLPYVTYSMKNPTLACHVCVHVHVHGIMYMELAIN